MKVLVTGANGFIGKNFVIRAGEIPGIEVIPVTRASTHQELKNGVAQADVVVHLAGVNRPKDPTEFRQGNVEFTESLAACLLKVKSTAKVIFASSRKAGENSDYGSTKEEAESALRKYADLTGNPVFIFRLPNVFGKWCRPDYNSAVATFCHNISQGLPIQVNDPDARLDLVYVDDVMDEFIRIIQEPSPANDDFNEITPVYATTVGAVADQIRFFHNERKKLHIDRVGAGLPRALYSTYLSYLRNDQFSYPLTKHEDPRGFFAEILKTSDSGQFSVFTALPGITRGGHYHHTKVEKFVIVEGEALFKFRHIATGECYELTTKGSAPAVVETIPGWAHDVTNVGPNTMIALLWANEVFDPQRPDTIARKV